MESDRIRGPDLPPGTELSEWAICDAQEIEGGDDPKIVDWEDLQQELARLWSLSSALKKAKERKESLSQRLESFIEVRKGSLRQTNELEEMKEKLEAKRLALENLSMYLRQTSENSQKEREKTLPHYQIVVGSWKEINCIPPAVEGIPYDKIIIHRTLEGKPYLIESIGSPFPNFNFNVSHHGDYVGIASDPLCLVGLDIVSIMIPERTTEHEFMSNFSLYLTALEWKNIAKTGSSEEKLCEFYRYWCLKEAFVKAIGAGLGFGFHRLEFHHSNWTNISVYIDGIESSEWKFSLLKIDERHWASIARGLATGADEQFNASLPVTEVGFTRRTVAQLIQSLRHGAQ